MHHEGAKCLVLEDEDTRTRFPSLKGERVVVYGQVCVSVIIYSGRARQIFIEKARISDSRANTTHLQRKSTCTLILLHDKHLLEKDETALLFFWLPSLWAIIK